MNEAKELTKLMQAITKQLNEDNERFEQNPDDASYEISHATIVIGDTVCSILLGGPQTTGLHAMIQHIADENFYVVDYVNDTVTD